MEEIYQNPLEKWTRDITSDLVRWKGTISRHWIVLIRFIHTAWQTDKRDMIEEILLHHPQQSSQNIEEVIIIWNNQFFSHWSQNTYQELLFWASITHRAEGLSAWVPPLIEKVSVNKKLSCHTGHHDVIRCCTQGWISGFYHVDVTKQAWVRIHPSLETQGK